MKTAIALMLSVLVTVVAAGQSSGPAERAGSGWDRASAARYLDDRMVIWFEKGKKLRTGDAQTTCVSCHTSVPYMLARPVLRRAMNVSAATTHESRTIEDIVKRVDTYGSHPLLYETNDAKKAESRGTEAVLNALVLATAGHPAAAKALAHMWEAQRADGAWDWLNFGLEPFETTDAVYHGAALAALAAGLAPQATNDDGAVAEAGVTKLQRYLMDGYATQRLYNQVWILLASTKMTGLLTSSDRQKLIAEVERRQRPDGGWSLESLGAWRWSKTDRPFAAPGPTDAAVLSQSDGYATGLVVYALRQAGVSADRAVVSKGLQWLRSNQRAFEVDGRSWTAWRAYSLNFDREHGGEKGEPWRRLFMSDAATAFAVLALTAP